MQPSPAEAKRRIGSCNWEILGVESGHTIDYEASNNATCFPLLFPPPRLATPGKALPQDFSPSHTVEVNSESSAQP